MQYWSGCCAKQHREPGGDWRGFRADERTLTPLELIERIAPWCHRRGRIDSATTARWHRTRRSGQRLRHWLWLLLRNLQGKRSGNYTPCAKAGLVVV